MGHDRMVEARSRLQERAIAVFEDEGVVATHLFGSLARGEGDAYSDIDLWMTVEDRQIDWFVQRRLAIFEKIADVLIYHDAPQNSPLGGSYTLVIHRIDDVLIQCDYYLAPESTSVVPLAARHLSGSDGRPRGNWILDTDARSNEDFSERLDFLICMSFIGIKKARRGDAAFLAFLEGEFERFSARYGSGLSLGGEARDVNTVLAHLELLASLCDERQCAAIAAVVVFGELG